MTWAVVHENHRPEVFTTLRAAKDRYFEHLKEDRKKMFGIFLVGSDTSYLWNFGSKRLGL